MAKTMRLKILLILALLLVLVSACASASPAADSGGESMRPTAVTLALVNGTLIDGRGGEPIPDAVILIDGERIVAVGVDVDIIPVDTPTIDVAGATILPGLINTHVHQAFDKIKLAAWAQAGVTTVRDLGNPGDPTDLFSFRDEASQDPLYARLIVVGPMLSTLGGYGGGFVTSPENARQIVNMLIDAGANLIKVAIEDDLQGRTWTIIPEQELAAIVDAAHTEGVVVSAHVSRSKHVDMALDAGIDDGSTPADDIDGEPRPCVAGGIVDVGHDEYCD